MNSKSFLQKIDEYSVGLTIQDMSDIILEIGKFSSYCF